MPARTLTCGPRPAARLVHAGTASLIGLAEAAQIGRCGAGVWTPGRCFLEGGAVPPCHHPSW